MAPGAAIGRIADVLNVRDRHPVLWEEVLAGRVRFFQAVGVANECARLSASLVAQVDALCAQAIGQWSWSRIWKELPKWIIAADPEAARAREVLARKERKVHVSGLKDGQVEVFARLAPADGIAFDDAIRSISAQLPEQELPAEIRALELSEEQLQRVAANHRRAAAMGQLARAVLGQDVLPMRELIVRIDANQVPPSAADGPEFGGAAQVDGWGAMLAARLPELLRGSKVIVRPVIDPTTLGALDRHDPSPDMLLALDVRDPYCVGPYGASPAMACDAEHTERYIEGDAGQTCLANLGNLSRFVHRAKTAGKIQVRQIKPGVFHWRYRSGFEFLVTCRGTVRLTEPAPPTRPPSPHILTA